MIHTWASGRTTVSSVRNHILRGRLENLKSTNSKHSENTKDKKISISILTLIVKEKAVESLQIQAPKTRDLGFCKQVITNI